MYGNTVVNTTKTSAKKTPIATDSRAFWGIRIGAARIPVLIRGCHGAFRLRGHEPTRAVALVVRRASRDPRQGHRRLRPARERHPRRRLRHRLRAPAAEERLRGARARCGAH